MSPSVVALRPVVDALASAPVEELCAAELQAFIASVSRERDRLDGVLSKASGQLAARTGGAVATPDGGERSVAGWLAETTRTSAASAGSALRVSGRLRDLPLVVQAVLDGVLTQPQAAVLARLVGRIPLEHLAESQADLVRVAAGRDPVELGRYVAHLVATHCEPALDDADRSARDRRSLVTRQDADGSLRGTFCLPAGEGEVLLTALEPLARRDGLSDGRIAAQRRADALVEIAERVLRHDELPEHGGHRPTVSYVLPAGWAAREDARRSCPTCSRCHEHAPASFADTVAGSLPGHSGVPAEHACATSAWTGPATRSRVEAVLCDARISRLLLDEVGQVRSLETLRDTVTPSQRRAMAARDGGCVARGCTRPPAVCDAHHLLEVSLGGATTLSNLVLLCRRHHVLWHLGRLRRTDLHVPWHEAGSGSDPPLEQRQRREVRPG